MNDTVMIRRLNDLCRTEMGVAGWVEQSQGINALPLADQRAIREKVENFNSFLEGSEAHGEHDCGAFEHNGETVLWQIDYYDRSLKYASDDPTDPQQTVRVLMIILASECTANR